MNQEALEKRLKELELAIVRQNHMIDQAVANLNVLQGGKSEIEYWLNTLTTPPT